MKGSARRWPAGRFTSINDLITYNLDIRQFAQDVIANSEGPELLRAFFHAIERVSVLDPTCGSGAFLFAALNVLEPLYEACLDRMQAFLDDLEHSGQPHRPEKFSDFRKVLEQAARHPNRKYFILKSIVVNNLYGVDIMEEAVEICKLRLFLKLVAQVEQVAQIEPLPDIDFNIRAGNTLIGYATYEDVKHAVGSKFDFEGALERIQEKAQDIERLFGHFRKQQTEFGGSVTAEDKQALRARLKELEDELNWYLAGEYGVKKADFQRWLTSHQPFHWFIDFHGIMSGGGFDVIIGNPPYVELTKVAGQYASRGFRTETCGNLYALCVERGVQILRESGWLGFVVQQPVVSTVRMQTARQVLWETSGVLFSTTYDDRPSKLFSGIHHARIAILLSQKRQRGKGELNVSRYYKWYKEERSRLFDTIQYCSTGALGPTAVFPKIGSHLELALVERLLKQPRFLASWISSTPTDFELFYKITGVGHWFTITTRPPSFRRQGVASSSTREQSICFPDERLRNRAFVVMNSSLFYWFYQVRTNCRDFNPSDYRTFPLPEIPDGGGLEKLAANLQQALDDSAYFATIKHSQTGVIEVEQFRPRYAKPVIDSVDRLLGQFYGLTADELDFIINYDIKYRLGRDAEETDGDGE